MKIPVSSQLRESIIWSWLRFSAPGQFLRDGVQLYIELATQLTMGISSRGQQEAVSIISAITAQPVRQQTCSVARFNSPWHITVPVVFHLDHSHRLALVRARVYIPLFAQNASILFFWVIFNRCIRREMVMTFIRGLFSQNNEINRLFFKLRM